MGAAVLTPAGQAVFGEAAAGGHLLLHAKDEAVQAAFAQAGVDGEIADVEGDYLAVIANNAASGP